MENLIQTNKTNQLTWISSLIIHQFTRLIAKNIYKYI